MATLEERVAALEAIVSSRAATDTAGAAKEPTEYYSFKYSGEEIDALLDKVAAMDQSTADS